MTLERKVLGVSWKADAGGSLIGYASTFGNVDRGGDVVVPGAFAATIADLKANGGIPLLADHSASTRDVLGTIHDAREDRNGLVISASFASTQRAQDVRTLLREGHVSKMSIGYETLAESFDERDGQRVRLLHEIKLYEVSVVVFPMNPEASVTGVKGLGSDLVDRLASEEILLRLALASSP